MIRKDTIDDLYMTRMTMSALEDANYCLPLTRFRTGLPDNLEKFYAGI